jgi:CheY-like chemotaxis protein
MSMVLIVDDDPSIRFIIKMILEKDGHEVIEAGHGAAALDLISLLQRLPDLLVTDLMMPVMDGEELIASLRSAPTTAAIPIVVVSGNADAALGLKTSGLVEAVVSKPFDPTALTRCIQAVASRPNRPPMVA